MLDLELGIELADNDDDDDAQNVVAVSRRDAVHGGRR